MICVAEQGGREQKKKKEGDVEVVGDADGGGS